MTNDTMQIFDNWLREWCEQRGWPYQPEMTASEKLNAQEYWAKVEGTDECEMREFERNEVNE